MFEVSTLASLLVLRCVVLCLALCRFGESVRNMFFMVNSSIYSTGLSFMLVPSSGVALLLPIESLCIQLAGTAFCCTRWYGSRLLSTRTGSGMSLRMEALIVAAGRRTIQTPTRSDP